MSEGIKESVYEASLGERLGGDSIPVDVSTGIDPFATTVREASTGDWLTGGSQAVHPAGLGDFDAKAITFEK